MNLKLGGNFSKPPTMNVPRPAGTDDDAAIVPEGVTEPDIETTVILRDTFEVVRKEEGIALMFEGRVNNLLFTADQLGRLALPEGITAMPMWGDWKTYYALRPKHVPEEVRRRFSA